jgi:hypothetical protein
MRRCSTKRPRGGGDDAAATLARNKSHRFFVAADVFPQTIDVVRTRAQPLAIEIVPVRPRRAADGEFFGVLLQYPGGDGEIRDYRALTAAVHAKGGHVVVAATCSRYAARAARRVGRRVVVGFRAALRRSDGLRRSARWLPRDEGRVQADDAGSTGRRHDRCERRSRRTALRFRRASSTYGARRRRPTSAPRRCCSR